MSQITDTPLRVDRGTRARLETLAKSTQMREVSRTETDLGGQIEVELDMPGRPTVHVHETVAPGAVMASARPPSSAAYLALLLMAVAWGQPSTVYEDELADTEYADVTGVWLRPEIESGEAVVQQLLAHGQRGYEWAPLDQGDWLARADPALRGEG